MGTHTGENNELINPGGNKTKRRTKGQNMKLFKLWHSVDVGLLKQLSTNYIHFHYLIMCYYVVLYVLSVIYHK